MSNQPFKTRPEIVNVNRNNPIFYPFSIKTSECSNINDIVIVIILMIHTQTFVFLTLKKN